MKVYNQEKTQILEQYDLNLGKLVEDKIVKHYYEQDEVEEQGHYEVIAEYPNGGKDVKWVIDLEFQPHQEEHDEEEKILVYIPYTEQEIKNNELSDLRIKRDVECFAIINRGVLWYNNLSASQIKELDNWYKEWLNVTETLSIPEKPNWLK